MKHGGALVIVALLSADAALAQSTDPRGGARHPATSAATPLQQLPAAIHSGDAAPQMSDRDFALAAAVANKFEIVEARLALSQLSDPKLTEFAQLMITDHTAALEELRAAARTANVELGAEIMPDAGHKGMIDAIKNRRGADFDRAYGSDQLQAHRQAVTLLDTYARGDGDLALRAWATTTLSVVRRRLVQLQSMGMGSAAR